MFPLECQGICAIIGWYFLPSYPPYSHFLLLEGKVCLVFLCIQNHRIFRLHCTPSQKLFCRKVNTDLASLLHYGSISCISKVKAKLSFALLKQGYHHFVTYEEYSASTAKLQHFVLQSHHRAGRQWRKKSF